MTELAVLQHLSASASATDGSGTAAASSSSGPSAAAALRVHPSVQRFHWQWGAAYEDETHLYILMELLRGGELLDRLIDGPGALAEPDAARVMAQLLEALRALHGSGVIPRDVKPENLLFRSTAADSGVVLTDFGLSLVVGQPDLIPEAAGTFGYAAPEVLEERRYTPACDVWSAGVVPVRFCRALFLEWALCFSQRWPGFSFPRMAFLDRAYVLLSGQMPFVWLGSDDYSGLLRRHLSEAQRGPQFNTMAWKSQNVSAAAKDFISSMLRHPSDPDLRPSPEELLDHEWLQQKQSKE